MPAPSAPLPPCSPSLFPSLLFKGGKRSLIIPPLSSLSRLQGFLEGMLQLLSRLKVLPPSPAWVHCAEVAPALISGGQQSHRRVTGVGEMRLVASRDHVREASSLREQPGLPHSDPSLPHPNSPTRSLPTGTADQCAQCFCFFFLTLARSKVPELPHGRSGPPGAESTEQTRQREQLSRHIPPARQTSPGVSAGDTWGLPWVSLAGAQLMAPITCELDGEQRVEGFRARGVQKLYAWRRRIAQQLAGSKVHCEKACPEVSAALRLPTCKSQTSGSFPPPARVPGAYPTAQPLLSHPR